MHKLEISFHKCLLYNIAQYIYLTTNSTISMNTYFSFIYILPFFIFHSIQKMNKIFSSIIFNHSLVKLDKMTIFFFNLDVEQFFL